MVYCQKILGVDYVKECLKTARTVLEDGGYTCVLCRGDICITDSRRGVVPLLELLESGRDCKDFCAADKVVGKAAAHLYRLLGVTAVYAGIISAPARKVLEAGCIDVYWDTLVPAIRNRTQTGLCPMETAVWDIEDPEEALRAVKEARKHL